MPRHLMNYASSLLIAISLCAAGLCLAQEVKPPATPAKKEVTKKERPFSIPKITISKETTWAIEPVGPSGFVDYLGAINRQCSQGVTPANNAVVLLYQALGPMPDGREQPAEFFRLLGIEPPPANGVYYEEFGNWFKRTGKPLPAGGIAAVLEMGTTTGIRPWTVQEFPEVAEWLQSIEKPLGLVADAVERTEYYSPMVSADNEEGKLIEVLLPGVQMSRGLARALVSRAMLRLAEKDSLKAWSDLLTIHRLGRLVGRGPTIIEGLVGIAIESVAMNAELRFISDARPTEKFIARYVKQLASLPPRALVVDKIDHCERAMFLDCCQQIARGRMQLNNLDGGGSNDWTTRVLERIMVSSVDWDEILKSGNRRFDRMVAGARMPTYHQRIEELRKLEVELGQFRTKVQGFGVLSVFESKPSRTDFAANILLSLLLPATTQCVRAESRCLQRYENLELAFALAAWRDEHGTYPEKLEVLAPKYIATVPSDLFKTQPLHYERIPDGYRFYSLGENETDDMGLTYGEGMGKDDLVVQMPMPLPKPAQ
ncbi:MAG: hypothetical protein JWM11_1550 [Planctomycetaceae bacterium]|nr:hypothetical protein [Planctomycetaceae bacterium]